LELELGIVVDEETRLAPLGVSIGSRSAATKVPDREEPLFEASIEPTLQLVAQLGFSGAATARRGEQRASQQDAKQQRAQ